MDDDHTVRQNNNSDAWILTQKQGDETNEFSVNIKDFVQQLAQLVSANEQPWIQRPEYSLLHHGN